jgi:hypothetical protein
MLGHLEVLLEGIVENPDRRLSELPILNQGRTARDPDRIGMIRDFLIRRTHCCISYLKAQAERTPADCRGGV